MKKLSLGMDSTLGNWRDLCAATFGPDSAPTKFIDEKIAKEGRDAEVIADERQLIHALGMMFAKELDDKIGKP